MARSVAEGFAELLRRTEPNQPEVEARRSHKRTIQQALDAQFKSVGRLEVIGSHTRDTAIRYFSDVDYLARLGRDDVVWGGKLKDSNTVLGNVRAALEARFPSTDVRVSGPAVVVKFQGGEGAVDVVPAFWTGTTPLDGYPTFGIPDAEGGWRTTSPQRHGKYISEQEVTSGFKLSRTVRLLKAWKYARTPKVPFLAFHVELLLGAEGICEGAKPYASCLLEAFRRLRDRHGAALNDPLGISGRIPLAYTPSQAASVAEAAAFAAQHGDAALYAELRGDIDEAFRQWSIVFNGTFPGRR